MGDFNSDGIPKWVIDRILNFFNQASVIADISGDGISEGDDSSDPDNWEGYSIGPTVAQRIIETRDALKFNRFRTLDELKPIDGFGQDKFDDLVRVFNIPSAEAFRLSMYENGVISKENWSLSHFTTFFEDTDEYRRITRNQSNFRDFVMKKVEVIAFEKSENRLTSRLVAKTLDQAYIDTYFNSSQTADFAFALWWWHFDADNWFSYETILRETSHYFSHHGGGQWEMELHFFKGFDHEILSDGIVPSDLPVVTSEAEQSISIWTSALYD